MKKAVFIINPKSGTPLKRVTEQMIDNNFDVDQFDYKIVQIKYHGHIEEIAKQAVADKLDLVIIAGGDGSVNAVAQQLINTNTAMGIIPTGSGNGLARHLKIPLLPQHAIQLYDNYRIENIDTGLCNNKLFLNVASMGFDATVAHHFSKTKTRGLMGYAYSLFSKYLPYKAKVVSIVVDDVEVFKGQTYMATVCNGSQYGYGYAISPKSHVNDGLLEVVVVKKYPKYLMPALGIKALMKKFDTSGYVEFWQGQSIKIKSKKANFMQLDGEPNGMEKELKVYVKPLSLKVAVPPR